VKAATYARAPFNERTRRRLYPEVVVRRVAAVDLRGMYQDQPVENALSTRTRGRHGRVTDEPDGGRSPQITAAYAFRPILHNQ
jgi:hypothetical protein